MSDKPILSVETDRTTHEPVTLSFTLRVAGPHMFPFEDDMKGDIVRRLEGYAAEQGTYPIFDTLRWRKETHILHPDEDRKPTILAGWCPPNDSTPDNLHMRDYLLMARAKAIDLQPDWWPKGSGYEAWKRQGFRTIVIERPVVVPEVRSYS